MTLLDLHDKGALGEWVLWRETALKMYDTVAGWSLFQ